jgi:3-oxoadipate enol-lactonase
MTAVALHYDARGSEDRPVLMLGGSLGTTQAMWDPQRAELGDGLRLIGVDLRGHGGSPAPPGPYTIAQLGEDVLALIDGLGLERVDWCGASVGGMVGQWLAINAPERIGRLILIGTSVYLPPASNWHERAAIVRTAGSPEPIADTVIGRWFTPAWAESHADVVARHRAMIVATPAEGYAGCCEAIAAMDLRDGLGAITAPTLVIAGAQDVAIPPEPGERIVAAVPGSRWELLDPGAHLASAERSGMVSALIADHLGRE